MATATFLKMPAPRSGVPVDNAIDLLVAWIIGIAHHRRLAELREREKAEPDPVAAPEGMPAYSDAAL